VERFVWEVERFEESTGESNRGCSDLAIDYRNGRDNCGKASLLQRILSINDFILRDLGACVDTVFGHVSFDTHLELMRSADGAVVTSL